LTKPAALYAAKQLVEWIALCRQPACTALYLCNGVVIGSLDENCTAVWVLNVFHEGVLVLTQHVLIHSTCMAL
jgi:hypothetical protein